MTKLYKSIDGHYQYWEIWQNFESPGKITIHWGTLGDWGQKVDLVEETPEAAEVTLNLKVQEKKAEGFGEPGLWHSMILQFQTGARWGNVDDLDFRDEWWDHLNGILGWSGNGSVLCGDIGSGTVNLYFEALEPEIAVKSIVGGIEHMKVHRKFIIALEGSTDANPTIAAPEIKVLYPVNYTADYNY